MSEPNTTGKLRVLFVGHIGAPTGYGRAARDWCRALHDHGDVDLRALSITDDRRFTEQLTAISQYLWPPGETFKPDIVVVHERIPWAEKAFDVYDSFIQHDTPIVLATAWEVDGCSPDIADTCASYQSIIVPTYTARLGLVSNYQFKDDDTNVEVIPHAFDLGFWLTGVRSRHETPISDRTGPYRFLYVGAWNDRKNPAGVLKAYLHAFTTENVELVLHCPGMTDRDLLEAKGILASSGIAPAHLPNLRIQCSPLSDEQLRQLYVSADVFVSAARGEAFNLPALEAAATGCTLLGTRESLPVLGTNGVHRIDSIDVPVFPGGSVRAAGGAAGRGVQFESAFPKGITCRQTWGEPDLGELAQYMKNFQYDGHTVAQQGVTYPTYSDLNKYSYESVGAKFGNFLRTLKGQSK